MNLILTQETDVSSAQNVLEVNDQRYKIFTKAKSKGKKQQRNHYPIPKQRRGLDNQL